MSASLVRTNSNEARGAVRDQPTLIALLSRTAAGDTGSFAALYDQTCARLYGVALHVLRDPGFAEETTQEVYLHVWRSAHSFDPAQGSALAWLTTLAHRRAVDRVRLEQAHTTRAARYGDRTYGGPVDSVADTVFDRIEWRTMKDGVASLPAGQRESITLAYYGGLTYREVADHLGVPLPTVKSRIRAGLMRLRDTHQHPVR